MSDRATSARTDRPEPTRSSRAGGAPGTSPGSLPGGLGPARIEDPTWCLVVGQVGVDLDGPSTRVAESLLCVADGAVGTRGVLEEDADRGPSVLVGGLYQPAPEVAETLMALPGWCALALEPGLPAGRRVLDLRDGVLTRVARGPAGRLSSARFACIARPGTGVMAAEVDAGCWREQPGPATVPPIVVRSALGGGAARAMATDVDPDGSPCRLQRIAVTVGSGRRRPGAHVAARRLAEARRLGVGGLLDEQRAAWAARWAAGDIEIVGDPEMTLAARFALFHLRSSARAAGEIAVGARGLTGPAYAGHVFWDTDVFVLPVLAATDPPSARALLNYRLRRLPAARARAAAAGHRGARFPWESARDGDDVTPRRGVDQHGETVPIRTGDLEEHITADVAWGAWTFAAWTGRPGFLDGPGQPLVVEPAHYWASRIRRDPAGQAHIDGVIGPDEYHEEVDDNAFTNIMARWNLRRAAELADRAGPGSPEADHAATWRDLASALVDGYDRTSGLYEQFAGYFGLEPLLAADLGPVPLPADLVLAPDRLARSQIVKQADVLMAHHLVPDEVAPGSLEANLEYYLPRTVHGSSLSPAIHASLLARARRPDAALELLRLAAAIDVEDLTETTAGGLHLANLGGIWQAIVTGFAGLHPGGPDATALAMDPVLPDAWEELRLRLRWHGRLLHLICRDDAVFVGCDRPLDVVVHGHRAHARPPGSWFL
jgi:trehalose/maltose hydrolase-like predicted phosphorylase